MYFLMISSHVTSQGEVTRGIVHRDFNKGPIQTYNSIKFCATIEMATSFSGPHALKVSGTTVMAGTLL